MQNTQQLNNWFNKHPQRKPYIVILGIIVVTVLASVSIFATGPNAAPATNLEKTWPVSVVTAQPQSAQPTFAAFGKLESNAIARLRSDLVAQIKAVHVKEGDWVSAGSILIELDDQEVQLRVLEKRAELKQHQANLSSTQAQFRLAKQNSAHFKSRFEVAQAKLQRHQDLNGKRLISRALLEEVTSLSNQASIDYQAHVEQITNLPNQIAAHEAHVAKAEAQLAQAKINLAKTKITAPFSGPILNVFAAAGDHNSLSSPLVEIADQNSFEVRVQVPGEYASQFQTVLSTAASTEQKIVAQLADGQALHLSRLSGQVRQGQTGIDAFFVFSTNDAIPEHSTEDQSPTLPPTLPPTQVNLATLGQMYNVTIEMPLEENLIALPVQSIYDNQHIYSVVEGRLVSHSIERVGERLVNQHQDGAHSSKIASAGEYQVLVRSADIHLGDQIIATQLPKAVNGLKVSVANSAEQTILAKPTVDLHESDAQLSKGS